MQQLRSFALICGINLLRHSLVNLSNYPHRLLHVIEGVAPPSKQ